MKSPAKRKSLVSRLLNEHSALRSDCAALDARAAVALVRHDPLTAHPGAGLLNPWKEGCRDCEREQRLRVKSGDLWKRKLVLADELATAASEMHAKRLAAAARSTSGKTAENVRRVSSYCATHKIPTIKPTIAEGIAQALSTNGLKFSQRTVERALQAINSR